MRKEDILTISGGATGQHGPHLPPVWTQEEFSYHITGQVDGIIGPGPLLWIQIKTLQRGGPLFLKLIDLNGQTLQNLVPDSFD